MKIGDISYSNLGTGKYGPKSGVSWVIRDSWQHFVFDYVWNTCYFGWTKRIVHKWWRGVCPQHLIHFNLFGCLEENLMCKWIFNAAKHNWRWLKSFFLTLYLFTCHFCGCFVSGLSSCLLNQRYCQEEKSIFTKTFLQVVFHQIQLCMSPSFKYSVFMHNHGNFV